MKLQKFVGLILGMALGLGVAQGLPAQGLPAQGGADAAPKVKGVTKSELYSTLLRYLVPEMAEEAAENYFERYDKDRDGVITLDEIHAAQTARAQEGGFDDIGM